MRRAFAGSETCGELRTPASATTSTSRRIWLPTDRPAHATTGDHDRLPGSAWAPEHPRDLLQHACMRGQFSGGAIPVWEFERDGERAPATTLRTSRARLLAQRAKCKGSAASFKLPSARVSGSAGQTSKHRPQTFCCIRDAPGIMRKPLNAAREAQGREMARFGTATARPKNLACHADHFRPQGYHCRAQGFELCALEFLACTQGVNRGKQMLQCCRPIFPRRHPTAIAHSSDVASIRSAS
jgi:hypothetical protein